MKPFDLEKALAGEFINVIGMSDKKRLIGKSAFRSDVYIVEGELGACTRNLESLQNDYEMWQEPRPRVQFDLPAPLINAEEKQIVFYIGFDSDPLESAYSEVKIEQAIFDSKFHWHKTYLEIGKFFKTEQDAQEWLDAMRNARR